VHRNDTTDRPARSDRRAVPVTTTSVVLCDAVPDVDDLAGRCRSVTDWCGVTTLDTSDGGRRLVARPVDGVTIEVDVTASPWSAEGDETTFIAAVADAGMPLAVASRVVAHRGFVRIRTTAARPDDMEVAAELGRDVTRAVASVPGALAWYSPTLGACVPTAQVMRTARVTQAA
jgi:hypothetical protein